MELTRDSHDILTQFNITNIVNGTASPYGNLLLDGEIKFNYNNNVDFDKYLNVDLNIKEDGAEFTLTKNDQRIVDDIEVNPYVDPYYLPNVMYPFLLTYNLKFDLTSTDTEFIFDELQFIDSENISISFEEYEDIDDVNNLNKDYFIYSYQSTNNTIYNTMMDTKLKYPLGVLVNLNSNLKCAIDFNRSRFGYNFREIYNDFNIKHDDNGTNAINIELNNGTEWFPNGETLEQKTNVTQELLDSNFIGDPNRGIIIGEFTQDVNIDEYKTYPVNSLDTNVLVEFVEEDYQAFTHSVDIPEQVSDYDSSTYQNIDDRTLCMTYRKRKYDDNFNGVRELIAPLVSSYHKTNQCCTWEDLPYSDLGKTDKLEATNTNEFFIVFSGYDEVIKID